MSLQDPISDMILRIKNAQARGHSKVSFGSSKLKQAICEVLSDEGFIKKVEVIEADSKKNIEVTLKYFEDKPCLLYTSPSPRDRTRSRMPSSA